MSRNLNKPRERSNSACGRNAFSRGSSRHRGPKSGTNLAGGRISTKSRMSRAGAELTEVGSNQTKLSFVSHSKDNYS